MDYGHPENIQKTPDFFTSGAGVSIENEPVSGGHDEVQGAFRAETSDSANIHRGLGNTAINTPEALQSPGEVSPNPTETSTGPSGQSDFEQTINLEMPPGFADTDKPMTPGEIAEHSISAGSKNLKIGKTLSKDALHEAEEAENKLSRDGDAASYYETIRGEKNGLSKQVTSATYGEDSVWEKVA